MNLRRDGWRSGAELDGAGTVGPVCIYRAASPEAIRKHARLADLPVTETHVADTVLVRLDPTPAPA